MPADDADNSAPSRHEPFDFGTPNPWNAAFDVSTSTIDWPDKHLATWPRGKSLRVSTMRDESMKPSPELLAKRREGDELWLVSSPPETRAMLRGRACVALLRDGQIVAFELRMMN